MLIRDDRKRASTIGPVGVPRTESARHGAYADHFAPDAVLYSCPDCGRAHFVTVDPCPSPEQAAREVAAVDGKRAA